MTIRRRLSSKESRGRAMKAARTLLMENGPQSVTLKAVAARVDRTHANLLHHFGSASGLQKALAQFLAEEVCNTIGKAVRATRAGVAQPRDVVDLTFDAFGKEGGGALASWMLASGNEDALDPIVEAIHELVVELNPQETHPGAGREMHELTLSLVLLALGDALLGEPLTQSLGVSRVAARDRAEAMLVSAYATLP